MQPGGGGEKGGKAEESRQDGRKMKSGVCDRSRVTRSLWNVEADKA
jgi:hypothetical protein